MDMPLEKIACVLDGQNSLEEMVQQQLLELQHKQQEIQGSMDLCRKLVADHAYDGQNIDFYLSYVKEEEKRDTALPSWRNLSAISQNTVSFIK